MTFQERRSAKKWWFSMFILALAARTEVARPDGTNAPASVPRIKATNAPAAGARTDKAKPVFAVKGYAVEGNTVLPPKTVDAVLAPHKGPKVDLDEILKAAGDLQLLYRKYGFATISVSLPKQQLTDGIVHLRVTEGRLSRITVSGNHHFSSNNVARALPGVRTNVLLNTHWFQPELDRANANADRQIYPVLGPGADPGATTLDLSVKDRLPLHGHVEFNNISTPNTPPLRIESAVQYNNLWQLDHQVGLEYNCSPESFKSGSYEPRFFDQPSVASYSTFYRIPLGAAESVRSAYDTAPMDFGYDQVTHIFRAPTASGAPELTFFASRSFTQTPVRLGPLTGVASTPLADITSQSAESDLITSQGAGARFTLPVREFSGIHSSLSFGIEAKNWQSQNNSTNLTYFQLYSLANPGPPPIYVLTSSQTIPLSTATSEAITYAPLEIGWSGSRPDSKGATSFSLGENFFLPVLESSRTGFEQAAGSANAGGFFTTVNALVAREQTLTGGWSASWKASGQYGSEPLPSNEEFALGGVAGVRGYEDGEVYGNSGWQTQFDLRAPAVTLDRLQNSHGPKQMKFRASMFMDYGEDWRTTSGTGNGRIDQWGTGLSVLMTTGEHFDARFTIAWALLDTPLSSAGNARAYFRVGYQF